ncbi:MAG: SAM-dependent methyltransferase [Myxococcota bacterium]|jgi:SAM-dependent methyltransferase
MSHDHDHDHDQDQDHSHVHHHSHGHEVPWSDDNAQWYEPGWNDPLMRWVTHAAELAADDVVVDVDCGDARWLSAAAAWVTRGQLIGVTPKVESARAAVAGHPDVGRLDLRFGSTNVLPVTDGAASVAWSLGLSGWQDPASTVAELHRVLRPGGRLMIATDADACGIDSSAPDDPAPLKTLLKSSGFGGVEVRRYRDGARRFVVFVAGRSRG